MLLEVDRDKVFIALWAMIVSFLLFLPSLAGPEDLPSPGSAPDPLDLGTWAGKVVLVDFWASWCAPCGESFAWMDEMRRKYAGRGLVIVAVNLDEERAAADRFLEDRRFDFEHVFDPEGRLAAAFDLRVMPTSILFDRKGKSLFRHEGFRPERKAEYEDHIVAALEGTASGGTPGVGARVAREGHRFGARPWQKGLLAKRAMLLECDPLDLAIDDHIYFSKEASSGGRGFGGGGCGCN